MLTGLRATFAYYPQMAPMTAGFELAKKVATKRRKEHKEVTGNDLCAFCAFLWPVHMRQSAESAENQV